MNFLQNGLNVFEDYSLLRVFSARSSSLESHSCSLDHTILILTLGLSVTVVVSSSTITSSGKTVRLNG